MGRVKDHNQEVQYSAECRAREMKYYPSPLEERMEDFLEDNGIQFEAQKIFYIYADDGWIIRYFIADFYIPSKNIIIEVDGKFHNNQRQKDKNRTKAIENNYPGIRVLRYEWEDLSDAGKMEELLWIVG